MNSNVQTNIQQNNQPVSGKLRAQFSSQIKMHQCLCWQMLRLRCSVRSWRRVDIRDGVGVAAEEVDRGIVVFVVTFLVLARRCACRYLLHLRPLPQSADKAWTQGGTHPRPQSQETLKKQGILARNFKTCTNYALLWLHIPIFVAKWVQLVNPFPKYDFGMVWSSNSGLLFPWGHFIWHTHPKQKDSK